MLQFLKYTKGLGTLEAVDSIELIMMNLINIMFVMQYNYITL